MFAEQYGPWAIIAGGSEGVGASFAHKIAAQGVNLVLLARKPEPLEEVAREVRAASKVQVRTQSLDLTVPDLLDRVKSLTDDIEIGLVVYNAGAESRLTPFLDRPFDNVMRTVRVNVLGTTSFCYHFGAKMRQRGRGGIIIVGATAGFAGAAGLAEYSASKAFEQMLCESLWFELKPHGINVLMLALGSTATPGLARSGLDLKAMGFPVQECDEAAQEGLDNLDNGPTFVAGAINREVSKMLCTADRRKATESLSAGTSLMIRA